MRIIIIAVLVVAILLGAAFYFIAPRFMKQSQNTNKPVTLTIWGLWEDENILKTAFDGYKKDHPNVTLVYKHQTSINYRSRVQTQVTQGGGDSPDIFMIHDTWLPMFLQTNSLSPMPNSVMSFNDYSQAFYPVVKDSLTKDGKVYAMARGVDGLVMFYNEDILRAAGVTTIPQTWPDFITDAVKTTVVDDKGKIKTAGAALGSTNNVDHWSDIIGLLFLEQPKVPLESPATSGGAEVLRFYTQFITNPKQKVWDVTMDSSTQAFAQGRLAFYLAPSWRAQDLRSLNPNLKFKTAPVPQLPGKTVAWASFWVYAVSPRSPAQTESWEFLKYFASAEVQKALYQQASSVRPLGIPYSRVDLGPQLAQDPLAGAVVNQAPYFKSWYLSSQTFDQGINDQIIKYYEDAVNSTLGGGDPAEALQTTQQGVQQVLAKYTGTPPAAPAPK